MHAPFRFYDAGKINSFHLHQPACWLGSVQGKCIPSQTSSWSIQFHCEFIYRNKRGYNIVVMSKRKSSYFEWEGHKEKCVNDNVSLFKTSTVHVGIVLVPTDWFQNKSCQALYANVKSLRYNYNFYFEDVDQWVPAQASHIWNGTKLMTYTHLLYFLLNHWIVK